MIGEDYSSYPGSDMYDGVKDTGKKYCRDCKKEVEVNVYNDKVEPPLVVCTDCDHYNKYGWSNTHQRLTMS